MNNVKLILRIIGYIGVGSFSIQILNLYANWFKSSLAMLQVSFMIGFFSLLILFFIDKLRK